MSRCFRIFFLSSVIDLVFLAGKRLDRSGLHVLQGGGPPNHVQLSGCSRKSPKYLKVADKYASSGYISMQPLRASLFVEVFVSLTLPGKGLYMCWYRAELPRTSKEEKEEVEKELREALDPQLFAQRINWTFTYRPNAIIVLKSDYSVGRATLFWILTCTEVRSISQKRSSTLWEKLYRSHALICAGRGFPLPSGQFPLVRCSFWAFG